MKAKNILYAVGFISAFSLCYSMDTLPTRNSLTSVINNNMMRARGWMNNFYKTYQEFGIIATLSSSFNMYSFKRVTGLNESDLPTASSAQLDAAITRINKMIEYKGESPKLAEFLSKIEMAKTEKLAQSLNEEEEARLAQEIGETNPKNIPYNEKEAIQYMQELQKQRNLKK